MTVPTVPGPPSKHRQMTSPVSLLSAPACAALSFGRTAPSQPMKVSESQVPAPSMAVLRVSSSLRGGAAVVLTEPASNKPRSVISEPKLGVPLSTCPKPRQALRVEPDATCCGSARLCGAL